MLVIYSAPFLLFTLFSSLSFLGKVFMEEPLSIRVVQAVLTALILAIVMITRVLQREEKGSI